MKEIGGYLELEHFKNGEYHAEALRREQCSKRDCAYYAGKRIP